MFYMILGLLKIYPIDIRAFEELLWGGFIEIWRYVDAQDEQWQSYGLQAIKWVRVTKS